jgi:hypothetical protein
VRAALSEVIWCKRCNWAEALESWSKHSGVDSCPRCGAAGMEVAGETVIKRLGVAWCPACETYHSS